jgi:hypothetical protein
MLQYYERCGTLSKQTGKPTQAIKLKDLSVCQPHFTVLLIYFLRFKLTLQLAVGINIV